MNRTIAIALLALGGCSFNPGSNSSGDAGGDGDIGSDAPIDTPDSGPCTAATATCTGDMLHVCAGAGATPVDTQCDWGCDMNLGRCVEVVPSANGLLASDLTANLTIDGLLAGGAVIDTDAGTITSVSNPDTVVRNNIRVFRFKSLHITGDITVVGSNALAIAVDGVVEIDGKIDMRGTCTTNAAGPGGFPGGTNNGGGSGTGGGAAISTNKYGGGGGGYGGNGGKGASDSTATTNGGTTYGNDVITMLVGGSGGGGGGGGGKTAGGGGGGAIQIVSNNSILINAGGINAGGCGGETGVNGNDGGGGGGAGGTILLEAPSITIAADAGLAVNGGGGGGGDGIATPADGENGKLSSSAAQGGAGDVGGNGGDGAAGTTLDGANGVMVSTKAGGGGGGGIGRIRLNVRDDGDTRLTIDAAAIVSPPVSDTNTTTTCTTGLATVQ